jgi:uncharacterized protein (DUF488 family)
VALVVWTVGHSNRPADGLVELLHGQEIEVLADVRSQPYSRHNPQFRRENLQASVQQAGLRYVFLGKELGGRPPEPEFYDAKGHPRYDLVAQTGRFQAGLERLLTGAAIYRVAIMCSEEDPGRCHRRLLVTRALVGRGVEVRHLRGNGSVISEEELDRELAGPGSAGEAQAALFD